jgi:hypothetical protein
MLKNGRPLVTILRSKTRRPFQGREQRAICLSPEHVLIYNSQLWTLSISLSLFKIYDGSCSYRTGITLLLRWELNITIAFLNVVHRLVFYLKYDASETGLFLRLQEAPTQLDPIERASPCPLTPPRTPDKVYKANTTQTNDVKNLKDPQVGHSQPLCSSAPTMVYSVAGIRTVSRYTGLAEST